jgi:hypothetical protein
MTCRYLYLCVMSMCVALFSGGCGFEPGAGVGLPGLVDVSGTVRLDGAPVFGAIVTFESSDGEFSYGMTDIDGRFRLTCDSDSIGVTPGIKTVRISTTRKIQGFNVVTHYSGDPAWVSDPEENPFSAGLAADVELIPARYNTKSRLTAEVSAQSSDFEFNLESQQISQEMKMPAKSAKSQEVAIEFQSRVDHSRSIERLGGK